MKFTETFNQDKLAYIIKHKRKFSKYLKKDHAPFKKLEKYLHASNKGVFVSEYHQTKNSDRKYVSRGCGLQSFCKPIRHTISSEFYNDIDIVNCHPVLLRHLCVINDISCEYLTEYIENRAKVINDIIKKNKDKKLSFSFVKTDVILAILNGGVSNYRKIEKTGWLKLYNLEMIEIREKLIYAYKKEYESYENSSDNKDTSFISSKLHNLENNILSAMLDFFEIENGGDVVLCFDGLMIPKHKKISTDVLAKCEKYILNSLDITIKLAQKEMKSGWDLDVKKGYYKKSKFKWSIPIYNEFSDYIKLMHLKKVSFDDVEDYAKNTLALISNGGNSYFLTKNVKVINYDTNDSHYDYCQVKPEKLLQSLRLNINVDKKHNLSFDSEKNKFIKNRKQLKTIADMLQVLMQDNKIPNYSVVDYYPYLNKPFHSMNRIFNLFSEFELNSYVQLSSKIKFENGPMYKHMFEVLCDSDQKLFNYLLRYVANMIQYPASVVGVGLLFKSEQGAGKDLFANFLSRLIGQQNYLSISNPENLFERFNTSQKGKLLIKINEISDRGKCYKNHNLLKEIITRENVSVEPKGFEKVVYRHFARYLFFTNNDNGLQIENSDRRFVLINSSNKKCGDHAYFKSLFGLLDDKQHTKDAFDYFASLDLSNFNIRQLPTTKLKSEVKISQMPSPLLFVKDLIKNYLVSGHIGDSLYSDDDSDCDEVEPITNNQPNDEILMRATLFYKHYTMYCDRTGERSKHSLRSFYKKLANVGIKKKVRKMNKKACVSIKISVKEAELAYQKWLKMPDFKFTNDY